MANRKKLLDTELKVINIGVKIFHDSLVKQGVRSIHLNWRPPADGDQELIKLLEKIT